MKNKNIVNENWKPTMNLRLKEYDWDASLCTFVRVLEQMWINDNGDEKWEEVPTYIG